MTCRHNISLTRDLPRSSSTPNPFNRVAPREAARTISLEMLPLVRDVIVTGVLTLPCVVLVAASELLLCSLLEHGRPGPAVALVPLLLLEALGLCYSLLVRSGSHLRTLGWALLLLATASLGLHAAGAWPLDGEGAEGRLWAAMVPAWALQAYLLSLLAWVAGRGLLARRLRLGWRHGVCMALYALALAMLTLAEVLLCWRALGRQLQQALRAPAALQVGIGALSGVAAVAGVGLGALGVFLVAEEEVDHLITTHGYADPLPLSRTAQGWGPTGARSSFWLLLGRIEEEAAARARARPGKRGRGQPGAAEGSAPWAGAGTAVQEPQPLMRSNSGSYANLEEDL
jgi:hypothetical protein